MLTCSRLVVEPGIHLSTGGISASDRIEPTVKISVKQAAKAVRLRFTVKGTIGWKEVNLCQHHVVGRNRDFGFSARETGGN